jgi:hypothetical protein
MGKISSTLCCSFSPGIPGQKNHGAQSVVLSGGYINNADHGESMVPIC